MYKCNHCKSEFSTPEIIQDRVPYGESTVNRNSLLVCPYCGNDDYEESYICEICGDTFTKSQHEDVCQSCINIIAKRFSDILKENFGPFEISILNSAYDGRNLEWTYMMKI